jgi:hypothetical protein
LVKVLLLDMELMRTKKMVIFMLAWQESYIRLIK